MKPNLILVVALVVPACVGTIDSGGPAGSPDAAASNSPPSDSGSGSGSGSATTDAAPAGGPVCKNVVAAGLSSGKHNAGQDCMNGCHNHGFTLAGTLYTAAGAALVGGTITVTDAAGATHDVVSQQNGNFYTSTPIAYPATVYASACPSVTPMQASVAASGAGCNNCHTPGATGHIQL
jgi:hypothetical protein